MRAYTVEACVHTAIASPRSRIVGSVDQLLLTSVGEIGMALPLWLLLVHARPVLLVGALALAGFANGLVNASLHTIVQLRTPRHLRTKLYSAVIAATSVFGPIALVATGPALEHVGVDPTLAVIIGAQTLIVLVFAWSGLRFRSASRELTA